MRTNADMNLAVVNPLLVSQAQAMSNPAPTTGPSTIAIVGFPIL